jgi:hypothetical protein
MNSESSELRTWLDGKFSAIDGRLDAMNARFDEVPTREEMNAGFARMATREEMQAQGNDLRAAIQQLHDESVAANVELREYVEFVSQRHAGETRRHFDVVVDGLRGDIKKAAEAQVATTERIDRLERKMDSGFADIRRDVAGIIDIAFKRRDRPIRGR